MSDEGQAAPGSEAGPGPGPRRTLLERLLGLFAEVHAGEAGNVLLMFANIFVILTGYYILKVVREGLMLGGVELFGLTGDEIKAYLPGVMTLLLLGVVPAYGALASAVNRVKLLNFSTGFVIVSLVLFYVWGQSTGVGTAIGLSFFVYLGIVNVFLIAQFWSFANDIYTERQGKRLFAIIAIGQSLGAVLGPGIAEFFAANDFFLLLVIAAALFAVCMALYNVVNRREEASLGDASSIEEAEAPLGKEGGFKLVFQTRYLLLIAFMILVTNVVNTTGEYILSNAALTHAEEQVPELDAAQQQRADAQAPDLVASGAAPDLDAAKALARDRALRGQRSQVIGAFYGSFFFWVNLVGVLVQMFLVSRVFKYLGVRAALFALPLISFSSYASFALIGGLAVLRIAKTAENATDYSLQNTVKQALFLPTDREAKYKAKAAIDTFFVRFGDTASALVVAGGLHVVGLTPRAFALVNVGLVLLWILLNVGIAREHKKLVPDDRGVDV